MIVSKMSVPIFAKQCFQETLIKAKATIIKKYPERKSQFEQFFTNILTITSQEKPFLKSETKWPYTIRPIPDQGTPCFMIFLNRLGQGGQSVNKEVLRITESDVKIVAIKREKERIKATDHLSREYEFSTELQEVPGVLPLKKFSYIGKNESRRIAYEMPLYKEDLLDFTIRNASVESSEIRQKKISIATQLIESTCKIHDKKVIHCDIKLNNVFLDDSDQPVLGDFGLAVHANDPIIFRGTDGYIPPEMYEAVIQNRSFPASPKIDMWSLGASLYSLFSGRSPFLKHQEEIRDIWKNHPENMNFALLELHDKIRRVQEDIQQFGLGELGKTIACLLDIDPKKRLFDHQFVPHTMDTPGPCVPEKKQPSSPAPSTITTM